jgi:hypothetical protein
MDEREMMRLWVGTWKRAGPEFEAIRREEVEKADNVKVLDLLEDAFNAALDSRTPEPTSGMVAMQHWFAKLRR